MAATITVGLSTYLIDFAGGQSAFRSPPYTQYATDHDTNYITLRNTVNQIITELNAVQGPNAGLGVDILVFNNPARAGGPLTSGLVGVDSFLTVVGSPTSELDIAPGTAIINSTAARNGSGATVVGSGSTGTRYIALDANGVVFQELSPNQRALDIYSATWTGPSGPFSAVTRMAEILWDGDDYEACRTRVAVGTAPITFPALEYEQFSHRITALERILAGFATDVQGNALGQPALRLGSVTAPGLAFEGDPNTGIYSPTADQIALTTGGVQRLLIATTAITFVLATLAIAGAVGTPSYSFTGDTNTGMFSDVGDTLKFATAGALVGAFDPTGNLDLPLNGRVKGSRTAAQPLTDATATDILFNVADAYDVGSFHDIVTNNDRFTVPTGYAGTYMVVANLEWTAPVTNARDLLVEVTKNGTLIPGGREQRLAVPVGENWEDIHIVVFDILADADIIRLRATTTDNVGALGLDVANAVLTLHKVA